MYQPKSSNQDKRSDLQRILKTGEGLRVWGKMAASMARIPPAEGVVV